MIPSQYPIPLCKLIIGPYQILCSQIALPDRRRTALIFRGIVENVADVSESSPGKAAHVEAQSQEVSVDQGRNEPVPP